MHTMYVGTYIYSLAPGQLVFIDDPYAYVCKAWEKFALCVRNFRAQNHKRNTMMLRGGRFGVHSAESADSKIQRKVHLGENS